jgi:hypothetical protein
LERGFSKLERKRYGLSDEDKFEIWLIWSDLFVWDDAASSHSAGVSQLLDASFHVDWQR